MTALAPGQHLGADERYELESRIATGGMGEVWSARDTVLGRRVAIKVLKHEYADDSLFRQRFATEARNAAALHHPGIAAVFDYGESPALDGSGTPRPFLVMELVEGQPLSALLRSDTAMDAAAAQDLLAQTGDALGVAHAAGIVHRDVKPANLLVTPGGRVKVTDFGIARAAESMALTATGQVIGTPAYLSPEQAEGRPATPASDVYALGVVAYECLVGAKPFEAETPVATALAHLRSPVPELPDAVPADLAAVVRRALAKAPEDRYVDGAAFAAALRDPEAADPSTAGPSTAVLPATEPLTTQAPATAVLPAGGDPTAVLPGATVAASASAAPRRRTAPLALGALALLAVVLLGMWFAGRGDAPEEATQASGSEAASASSEPSPTPTETPTPTPSDTAGTVTVDANSYLGQPVKDAAKALEQLGLVPELVEIANPGTADGDTVADVSPTGALTEGATVTLTYYGKPPKGNSGGTTKPGKKPGKGAGKGAGKGKDKG